MYNMTGLSWLKWLDTRLWLTDRRPQKDTKLVHDTDNVNRNEGGRSALAGYLFQILGTYGVAVQVFAEVRDAADDPDITAVVAVEGRNYVLHEPFGQDVGIIRQDAQGNQRCSLLQFKYSKQHPPESISPSDLEKIAATLENSKRWAEGEGKAVSEYLLVTNRALSDPAQLLKDTANSPDPLTYTTTTRGGTQSHTVSDAHKAVIHALKIKPIENLNVWSQQLQEFAETYGVPETEIERGINTLIGNLVDRTVQFGSAVAVTKEDIVAAFTRQREARPITTQRVAELAIRDLEHQGLLLHLHRELVRREVMRELAEMAESRALIVLEGSGGCGKTATMWHHAKELTRAVQEGGGTIGAIKVARGISRNWITELICEWGAVSATHEWRKFLLQSSLDRFRIANKHVQPPLLFLGVDGLDEGVEDDNKLAVEDAVRWFTAEDERARTGNGPPLATLVITCRDLSHLVRNWPQLGLEATGKEGSFSIVAERLPPPALISVTDFSPAELLGAAQEVLPLTLFGMLTKAAELATGRTEVSVGTPLIRTLSDRENMAPSADEGAYNALLHPVMWQALLRLDDPDKELALRGDEQGLHRLACAYVTWFCVKAQMRLYELDEAEIREVLRAVAVRSGADRAVLLDYDSDWKAPACGTHAVSERQAKKLYNEAQSGGLIMRDRPLKWYWRHSFVRDYLASAQPGDYC